MDGRIIVRGMRMAMCAVVRISFANARVLFHAPMPTRRTRPRYGKRFSVLSNLEKRQGFFGNESGGRLKNPRGLW